MNNNQNILLSTAYFPPVQYFVKFLQFNKIYIEQHENFMKQTYRNRCEILAANGPVSLVIPVVKGRGSKIKIRDLKISYDTDWQRNHWRTIFSAYNSSPFFEFYRDEISPFFEKKWKYIFDFNLAIIEAICDLTEIDFNVELTDDFEKTDSSTLNFREAISPKEQKTKPDPNFHPQEYTQVFAEKFGFVSNLSILDLIFNQGPNSYNILESSRIETES
ncbi:MAG: WbqC family protein [Tangfeifania sp.]